MTAVPLIALFSLGACATHRYSHELEVHNVAASPIEVRVRELPPSGPPVTIFSTELAPGEVRHFHHARRREVVPGCEALLFVPDSPRPATRLTIEEGVAAQVDVDLQDGRVVAKERRPE